MLTVARMATCIFPETKPCTFWGYGNRTAMALLLADDEEAVLSKLLGYPLAMQKKCANGVSGKPKNFGVKIKSILHDVLGDTCPSTVRPIQDNHVCVYCKSVNGVNEIIQHAISFTLFGILVIFGTPHCDFRRNA